MIGEKRDRNGGKRAPIGDRVTVLMIDKNIAADMKAVATKEKLAAWTVTEDAARESLK
jgi:hypothetical protein